MAAQQTVTVGTTDYEFDYTNSLISVENLVAEVTAADLKTATRTAEYTEVGIVFPDIVDTANPVTLTASASTFLVVILLDLWKIDSLSTSGTFTVGEGNVVHITDGSDIFNVNALVAMINNISAAGVLVETGVSGLTAGEAAQLLDVFRDMGLDSTAPVTITENTADTSYDQTSTGITKQIRTSGSNKTVTRV